MVVCKFFLQGSCKYGNRCWNEHSQGHEGGGSGFGRNSYGGQNWSNQGYNRFGALSQNTQTGQGRSKPVNVKDLTIEQTIDQIAAEVSTWESSKMWPFSCFACVKESPCLPGFEDLSMEELRLQAYEAQKQGNTAAYTKKFEDLVNEYRKMRHIIKRPTIEVKQKLMEAILNQQMMGASSGTSPASSTSVFGGAASNQTSGLFGKSTTTASAGFGSANATNSVFGGTTGSSTANTGLFGKPANAGLFGKPAVGNQSVFGGQSAIAPSAFGSPANATGLGTHSALGASVFGGQSAQPNSGNAMNLSLGGTFGNQGNTPQSVFGTQSSNQQQFTSQLNTNQQAQPITQDTSQSTQSINTAYPKLSMYTPIDQLTAQEKEQFSAQQFTPGKIPSRPPPQEFCH